MARSADIIRRGFTGLAVGWAATLPLATFVTTLAQPAIGLYLLALGVYAVGGVVCHQLPERSFHVWGRQMPVCARCTGIYAGAAIAAVVAGARTMQPLARRLASAAAVERWTMLALASAPAAATLVFEWTTGVTPSNGIRAASGVVLGAAVSALVVCFCAGELRAAESHPVRLNRASDKVN